MHWARIVSHVDLTTLKEGGHLPQAKHSIYLIDDAFTQPSNKFFAELLFSRAPDDYKTRAKPDQPPAKIDKSIEWPLV